MMTACSVVEYFSPPLPTPVDFTVQPFFLLTNRLFFGVRLYLLKTTAEVSGAAGEAKMQVLSLNGADASQR